MKLLTKPQELLLQASLLSGEIGVQAWNNWSQSVDVNNLDKGSDRLLGLLYRNLENYNITDSLMLRLKGIYRHTWSKNQVRLHSLASILRTLQTAGIKTLILRGAALVLQTYKDFGVRPADDLGVLVHPQDVRMAITLLSELGWTTNQNIEAHIPYRHFIQLKHVDGQCCDIYWHIFPEFCQSQADEEFWCDALSLQIEDVLTHTLNPTDQLLYVCVQASQWNAIPSFRWFADAIALLQNCESEIDWQRLVIQAQKHHLSLSLSNSLKYLKDTFELPIPDDILLLLQSIPKSKLELMAYQTKARTHKLLGRLPELWYQHIRVSYQTSHQQNLVRKLVSFPKYLQHVWGIENMKQLWLYVMSQGIKRLHQLDIKPNINLNTVESIAKPQSQLAPQIKQNQLSNALVNLLLGDRQAAETAIDYITQNDLWLSVVGMTTLWRVVPQLRQRIQEFSLNLDTNTKRELQKVSNAATAQANIAAHRSAQALHQLNAALIPAITFKGIGLIGNLYSKPSERMVNDVDVLINAEDLHQTCEILSELGYKPEVSSELDNYVNYLECRTHPDNLFLVLKNQAGFEIDLHWGLVATAKAQLNTQEIIQKAQEVKLNGTPIRVASPPDAMMLTVHHAVRESMAPSTTIKDLFDLAKWWQWEGERWQLDEVIQHAKDCGLSQPLLALWQLLSDFDSHSPAQKGVIKLSASLTAKENKDAQGLVELFKLQLQEGKINRDILHIFSISFIKRFLNRRLQKAETIKFDNALWGIKTTNTTRIARVSKLFKEITQLNFSKFNAYKALLRVQKG
jgi:Uncharacterised nucleotidyltransferase